MATYKVLGQAALAATTDTAVYTAAAAAALSTIHVTNRGTADATFRIAIVPSGDTLGDKHYIAYDKTIAGNDLYPITTGVTMASGDVLRAYASNANVSVSVFGCEGA